MQTTLSDPSRAEPPRWLELVAEQVSELRFGVVQLTVHDGQVVQVERTERIRLTEQRRSEMIPANQKPGGKPATRPTDQTTGGTLR